jgi:hypothetical protein
VGRHEQLRQDRQRSVLAPLRELVPRRPLRYAEALRIAEQQAELLLRLTQTKEPPVPTEFITHLPRLQVVMDDLPASGSAHWNGRAWLIVLNRRQHEPGRRFALAHELKHVIDHTTHSFLYRGMPGMPPVEQAERAADYFAGCLLAPQLFLGRACADGAKTPAEIGRLFAIPRPLANTRLAQCGLAPGKRRSRRSLRASLISRLRSASSRLPPRGVA